MNRFLETADGGRIAWRQRTGSSPGVLFLGGFHSSMAGNKAEALDRWCIDQGVGFTRFDYFGHGASSGAFAEGTIGRWLEDSLRIIDECTDGPLVLVGSSMGGWLMLHCALARPERIAGLLGIASAADFTERGIWANVDSAQRSLMKREGYIDRPSEYDESPYRISWQLIENGREHLLSGSPIAIDCPVRLVHGQADMDVPWQWSVELAEDLTTSDVTVTLIKDGDHRLSTQAHLNTILSTLKELIER